MTPFAYLSKKLAVSLFAAVVAVAVAVALLPAIDRAEAQNAGSISGVAWVDSNGDGLQGSGEAGLGGVTTTLYRFDDVVVLIGTTVTAADGSYSFGSLDRVCYESTTSCSYQVYFDNPDAATYAFSPQNVGSNDSIDSDVRKRSWGDLASADLTISPNAPNNTTTDAGFALRGVAAPGGSISGVAWVDTNGDGIRSSNETGLAGVDMVLFRFEDTLVRLGTTVTAANGSYSFGSLDTACHQSTTSCAYQVRSLNPDADTYAFSPHNAGSNDAIDSDARKRTWGDVATAWLRISNTAPTNTTTDTGLAPLDSPAPGGSISGVAWVDTNGDGIRGSNETGLGGVNMVLYRFEDTLVRLGTTVTAANGSYSFNPVVTACYQSTTSCAYQVRFLNPDADTYAFSPQNAGSNDAIDSDARKRAWGDVATAWLRISNTAPTNTTTDAGLVPEDSDPPVDPGPPLDQDPRPEPDRDPNGPQLWGIGGGGATAGYSINPFDTNKQFIGTDMGVLFRSDNRGASWDAVSQNETQYHQDLGFAIGVGFTGTNGNVILHAPQGLDPVRSTDGGMTFSPVNNWALWDPTDATLKERIRLWFSDTANPNTIYAATSLGLWRSENAGAAWSKVITGQGEVFGVFIDHNDNGKVFAATSDRILVSNNDGDSFNLYADPDDRIYQFTGGSDRNGRTLAFAADDHPGAQALANQGAYAPVGITGNQLVSRHVPLSSAAPPRTTSGVVWVETSANNGFEATDQFMGGWLRMAENDPTTIVATGGRDWGLSPTGYRFAGTAVWVSTSSGSEWELELLHSDSSFRSWPQDKIEYSPVALNVGWHDSGYYSFTINQTNSANFGGSGNFFSYATENRGEFWLDLANEYVGNTPHNRQPDDEWLSRGLNVTSAYDIYFNPQAPRQIFAAFADVHGLRSTNRGDSWEILESPHNSIYDYAFDADNANVVYRVTGSLHDAPYQTANYNAELSFEGTVERSTDGGDDWDDLGAPITQYLSIGYDAGRNDIYVGSQTDGVWRSRNNGGSWQKFNVGLPQAGPGEWLTIPQIEVLENGNVYALVATSNGFVGSSPLNGPPNYKNRDVTGIYLLDVANDGNDAQWQLLRGTINEPAGWQSNWVPWLRPHGFAVDHDNPNNLWLVDAERSTNQYLAQGVWRSTDGGQTWDRTREFVDAVSVEVDPNDSQRVYLIGRTDNVDTHGAVFFSSDGGVTWTQDERLPFQRDGYSIAFDPASPNKVVYGFFGSGMVYLDKPTG